MQWVNENYCDFRWKIIEKCSHVYLAFVFCHVLYCQYMFAISQHSFNFQSSKFVLWNRFTSYFSMIQSICNDSKFVRNRIEAYFRLNQNLTSNSKCLSESYVHKYKRNLTNIPNIRLICWSKNYDLCSLFDCE